MRHLLVRQLEMSLWELSLTSMVVSNWIPSRRHLMRLALLAQLIPAMAVVSNAKRDLEIALAVIGNLKFRALSAIRQVTPRIIAMLSSHS